MDIFLCPQSISFLFQVDNGEESWVSPMKFRKLMMILFLIVLYIVISTGLRFYEYYEASSVGNLIEGLPDVLDAFTEESVDSDQTDTFLTASDEAIVSVSGFAPVDQSSTAQSESSDTPARAEIKEPDETTVAHQEKFHAFQEEAMAEFKDLAEEFKQDLNDQSNTLSQGMLLFEYERKAKDFEQQIDERFEDFLKEIEVDVDESRYESLKKSYEKKYQRAKKELVERIMKEASEFMVEE